ncbi:MAG: phytoene/squalene synthase family protein [Gemmatimonadales bacterium]|nr:phytoene/squalene synthase family protein [Gemmatimonadales bacterium]
MPSDAVSAGNDAAGLIARCQAILSHGSASFSRAARLLERTTREGCVLLYAWGRHCDDVIDGQTLGQGQQRVDAELLPARLARLRAETERALTGEATELPFQALALLVRRHRIPPDLPRALLDGMAMDVAGRRYQTLDELTDYCHCVAGVVAIMTGRIMGLERTVLLDRMGRLGQAVQLTNIARDLVDDAGAGRIYVPLGWLQAAGIPDTGLGWTSRRAALAGVARRLLDEADSRYAEADPVIAQLPARSAAAVAVGRALYSAIGTEIRRRGPRAWDSRVTVPNLRRSVLTMTCLIRTIGRRLRPTG